MEIGSALVDEVHQLNAWRDDADRKLNRGHSNRVGFAFSEAADWYRQAAPVYAQMGYLELYTEALYRLGECEEKAELKAEADSKFARAKVRTVTHQGFPFLDARPCFCLSVLSPPSIISL
jgi:hypothetical protein